MVKQAGALAFKFKSVANLFFKTFLKYIHALSRYIIMMGFVLRMSDLEVNQGH